MGVFHGNEKRTIQIHSIPAIIWGTSSKRLYLYIHGQGGCKEEAEAEAFANIACRNGWQVLSIDLPEHGDRKSESNSFDPWHIVPELNTIMKFAKGHWEQISLFANSIGAWFSMLSFKDERLRNCLFVSPVLDMKKLISNMMKWANVSEARLKKSLLLLLPLCKHFLGSIGNTLQITLLQNGKYRPKYYMERMTI
ncbi:alpha/beta hydrolase [Enterococcus faecium]